MKESREKFLDRYRAISSASTEAAAAGSLSPSPTQIDLTVSNEDIRLSVREVMRREWESMREEHSSLPQLPNSRASTEDYMEQVSSHYYMYNYVHVLSIADTLGTAEIIPISEVSSFQGLF